MKIKNVRHLLWCCSRMVLILWKPVWRFLTTLNTLFPYMQACSLTFTPRNWKQFPLKSTQMFKEVLFVIAEVWEWPRCPSIGDWINSGISWEWHRKKKKHWAWRDIKCFRCTLISGKGYPKELHRLVATVWYNDNQWLPGIREEEWMGRARWHFRARKLYNTVLCSFNKRFVQICQTFSTETNSRCKLWAFSDEDVTGQAHQ